MAHIIRPDARYHRSYLEARDEMAAAGDVFNGTEVHGDGAWQQPAEPGFPGLDFTREGLEDPAEFRRFVRARRMAELEQTPRPAGWVPCTYLWFIEGDTYLGSVALRHRLNDFLHDFGGHIGYTIRPSARRRGHATEALRQTLELAGEMGFEQVLLTAKPGNVASIATITAAGGVLDADQPGTTMLRYWVPVPEGLPEQE